MVGLTKACFSSMASQGRSRWSGRSGHGRTGFGPYQTIYRLRNSLSTIKLYCSLRFKSVGSLPRIVFHALGHTISHALSHVINPSSFNCGIRSFKVSVLLIVGFCLQ